MKKNIKNCITLLLTAALVLTTSAVTTFASTQTSTSRITTTKGKDFSYNLVETKSANELNTITPGVISGPYYTVKFDANGSYFKYYAEGFRIANGTEKTCSANNVIRDGSGRVTAVEYKIPASDVLLGYLSYPENKTGMHCIGWNTTPDADTSAANLEVGDTTTLYAVWEADTSTYTMNYNVNLGQWTGYLQADRNNRRELVDTALELQKPTREGFNFVGWSTDPQNPTADTMWTEADGLTKYDQVFAIWEPASGPYVVTFHGNGGKIDNSDVYIINVPLGSTGTFLAPTPTRTGYAFQGWATTTSATEGTKTLVINREEVKSDLDYYATWKVNSSDPVQPDPDDVTYDDNTPIQTWYIGKDTLTDVRVDLYEDGRLIFSGAGSFDTTNASNAWLSGTYKSKIKSVNFQGTLSTTSLADAFNGATNLETFNLGTLDISNCTDTSNMFKGCKKLNSFSAGTESLSKLTKMSGMFDGCTNITSIDLPSMASGTLRSMDRAFADCPNLTALDLSKTNTKFVTSMTELCSNDNRLSTLNISDAFYVPATSYVSYDTHGGLFEVDSIEPITLNVFGQMSPTFSTYTTTSLGSEKDNRKLEYDKTANMLSVTYDFNYPDGLSYKEIEYYNKNETVTRPENPEFKGYVFDGWMLGTEAYDFTKPITENIVLTAKWKEYDAIAGQTFTITFKYVGEVYQTQQVQGYGKVTEPTKPDKTETLQFKYWSEQENGEPYNFTKEVRNSFTLYGVTERRPDVHRVIFNYNGGKYKGKTSVSVNVLDGHKVKKPSYKPKSSGEYFTGWYESADGDDKWDFSTKIYEDITLYAGWSDDKEDEEDKDKDKDKDEDKEEEKDGETTPNVFEQLLDQMLASPSEETVSDEIMSVSAGGIPQTGIPYNQKPIWALISIVVLAGICVAAKKMNQENDV